jgi:hypothetical protein
LGFGLLALVSALQTVPVAAATRTAPHVNATIVDRTLKGDRLPVDAASGAAGARTPAGGNSRMPEGCEATVSAMTQSPLAHTPGRCIS